MSVATQRTSRRQQREETRRQILDAAQAFLRERSFRELSVEALMARTGHTRTVFYRHFDDIPALVLALIAEVGGELVEVAEEWTKTERVAPDEARRRLAVFVDFHVRNGPLVHAVAEAAHHDEEVEQRLRGDGRGLRRADDERDRGPGRRRRAGAARRSRDRPRPGPDAERLPQRRARPRGRNRPRPGARDRLDDLDANSLPGALRSTALWPGRWPAEDRGSSRTATVAGAHGLGLGPANRLETVAIRDAVATTMVVLREPGEVYVLRHTLGRRPFEDPFTAWVERVDPQTLEVVARSEDLTAGPFWPGGLAAHANGSLHVVCGNHAHRLSPDLELLASAELPGPRPYNSFVVLGDGTLATKDFDRDLAAAATLVLLDPETLERRCDDVDLGEPAIARLSADGELIYVVGAETVFRLRWDGSSADRDPDWGGRYLTDRGSYGWDPVVSGGQLWFMDNGEHDFVTTMRGAGVAPGPVRLLRFSLSDHGDRESAEISGLPRGAVTNPPLYDPARQIAIAYDSANGVVAAFRFDGRLEPLWRRELSHAAHVVLFAETGELVLGDFEGPAWARSRVGRALGRPFGPIALGSARLRRLLGRQSRDQVVVVDIETGAELGRSAVPSLMQSVVFPAPGFDHDIYWCTMTTLARVAVR